MSLHLTPGACDLVTNKRELLFWDDIFHLNILLILLCLLAIRMRMWPYQDSQGPSELNQSMRPKGQAEGRALLGKTRAFMSCSMSRVGGAMSSTTAPIQNSMAVSTNVPLTGTRSLHRPQSTFGVYW
jgi:hypothetical protein